MATDAGVRWRVPDDRHRALALPACPDWCSGDPDPDDGDWVCFRCYAEADLDDRLPLDDVVIDAAPQSQAERS